MLIHGLTRSSLTNILSLAEVRKQYRVTYDSAQGLYFTVHRSDQGLPDLIFEEHECGLYIWEPEQESEIVFQVVNTVEENKKSFTKREIEGAKRALELEAQLMFPSD